MSIVFSKKAIHVFAFKLSSYKWVATLLVFSLPSLLIKALEGFFRIGFQQGFLLGSSPICMRFWASFKFCFDQMVIFLNWFYCLIWCLKMLAKSPKGGPARSCICFHQFALNYAKPPNLTNWPTTQKRRERRKAIMFCNHCKKRMGRCLLSFS